MPDTPSITIVKSFTYRGQPEEFSNTYHFTGTTPANTAAWKALADAIIAAEKLAVQPSVSFVRAYGYEAGTEHSVAQIDYAVAPNTIVVGTQPFPSGVAVPGDIALTIRWETGRLNSRGKKIYCRKYMHGALSDGAPVDKVYTGQATAYLTFANKLIDGTLPGSFKYCAPQGALCTTPSVGEYLTTRTLKRRGKRPLASG